MSNSWESNHVISPAALHPIPVLGVPFDYLIIDYVRPLPETMSGNEYLLILMNSVTHYPETIPLCSLKAKGIVKTLIKYVSAFRWPRYIQVDQGSNCTSCLFSQVMKLLAVDIRYLVFITLSLKV